MLLPSGMVGFDTANSSSTGHFSTLLPKPKTLRTHTTISSHSHVLVSMGRNIDELPTEILQLICCQLCTHCREAHTGRTKAHNEPAERVDVRLRRSALAFLCRVSKVFSAIATPYLYHFLFHQWPEDQGRTLPSLIETVTRRPDLARLVKHVEVDHANLFTLPEYLIQEISNVAVNRDVNLLPGWFDDPGRRALVFLEVLLLQTPNIETLHLLLDDNKTTFSDLTITSPTTPGGFCLPTLTTLTAAPHPRIPSDWDAPFHFRCGFLPRFLIGLPQLRNLCLHRAESMLFFDFYANSLRGRGIPPSVAPFASITSLTLSHVLHLPYERMIEECDRLEVFKMTFGHKFARIYAFVPGVLRALQKHRSSLNTFVFTGQIYLNWPDLDDPPTFREFTNLRSFLMVPYISWMGGAFESIVDFLPSSVRRLRLLDVKGPDAREALWGLHTARVRGQFEHLEELVVNPGAQAPDPIGRDQQDGWEDPGMAIAALGMAFGELENLRFSIRDVDGTVDGLVEPDAVSRRCLGRSNRPELW